MQLTDDQLDRMAAELRRSEDARRASIALSNARPLNPSQARQDDSLRRATGFPTQTFDDITRAVARARERQNRASAAIERAPELAHSLSDPQRFERASDDLDTLADISESIRRHREARTRQPSFRARVLSHGVAPAVLMSMRDVVAAAGSWTGESLAGLAEGTLDLAEYTPLAIGYEAVFGHEMYGSARRALRNVGDYYQGSREAASVDYGNHYVNTAVRGVESVPAQMVALVSAARGQPGGALAILSTLTGGSSYREARAEGLSVPQALTYAATDASFEAAGEMLPLSGFAFDIANRSGFARTLLNQILRENVGEQVTTHLQDFNRWAEIDVNRGRTFADYLADRPQAMLDTFIATTAAVGLQTGGAYGANRAIDRFAEARRSRMAARNIDRMMEAASRSRLRAENPDEFREILGEQLDGTTGENLYVPAEAVRELFQSPEDLAEDSFWGDYSSQIYEASSVGGDVVIPMADAATRLPGSPQWEAIKDHVRTSPGGMSRTEAMEWEAAFEDAVRETGEQFAALIEADRLAMEPVQKIHEAMRDKLMLAGFTPDAASQLATQFAQRQRVRAERLGRELTGTEAGNVEIRTGEDSPAGRTLEQSTPEFREWFAASKVVDENGNPLVVYHGTGVDFGEAFFGGNFFSSDPSVASRFAELVGTTYGESGKPNVIPAYIKIERPRVIDAKGDFSAAVQFFGNRSKWEEALNDPDSDGIIIKNTKDEGDVYVPRSPAQIKSVFNRGTFDPNDPRIMYQSDRKGARGRITFTEGGKYYIDLFESRDLSTFIHESGHLYLEELRADADLALEMDTDEARQLFADWETVKAWFKREGHEIGEDGTIPTEAHELFARGFERFAMEGKAPSSALKRAFEAFRTWLLNIYKVVENLKAPITPGIRDVMTRLLATDEEITAAQEEQRIKALFNTAEEAGMTEAEFTAYRTATEEARSEAYDALLYRTMASIRAQRTKEYRNAEANVRAEVMGEVDNQPVFRALRLFRTGKIGDEDARTVRLDRQFLVDSYGPEALDAMPRTVPPIYGNENIVHPDLIAEETGFASGDELIRTLMGHEAARLELRAAGDKRSPRQVQIDEMTAARMAERYGDPLRDGSIEEEARALIHNDRQGEVIASEIRALARRSNRKPTPYAIARQWARDKIAAGTVAGMISGSAIQQYQRSARKAGQAAAEAMLKQDVDQAYREKQRQMLNNALISEATKARDIADAAAKRLGKIARRKAMASVDQDYLDQAHGLLEQVNFRPRSQVSIDRQRSFEDWAREQEAAGHDIIVPQTFAAMLGQTHWTRLSVEELIGLDAAVKQILHLGRLKQTLLDGQERRSFDEAKGELIASADGAGKGRKITAALDPMRSFGERVKSRIRWADAAMIKVETIADWLDQGNSNGPWNRFLFKPLADAQGRQGDLMRVYVEKINALIKAVPRKQARDWDRKVNVPELINRVSPDPNVRGRPLEAFGKDQVVMIALNMGNAGNRQRLLDGYGWTEPQVQAVLDRLMAAEDWQFVQGVWDTVDELWPDLAALERRVNGVEPEKIEAIPIETPYGTFRGGYFPAVYDTTYSTGAELQAEDQKVGGGAFFKATTRASSTKDRATRVERPILLNMSVITRHLGEVIHDITHREAVIQVAKILSNGEIRSAVNRRMGPEYLKAMEAWLDDIAKPSIADSRTFPAIAAIGRHLHKGVSLVGLGYRVSTALIQPLGLANMTGIVGERAVLEGMAAFTAHPKRTYREVTERSAEMRDRFATMDASIAEMYRDRAKHGLQRIGPGVFEKHAFDGILYADLLITTGGWIGAYNKGLREGMSEEEAVYYADKVIRTSQGSGAAKDKSAILRANMLIRTFYPFFSYLNALYNQQRDIGRRVRNVRSARDVAETARRFWWIMVVPPLVEALVRGEGPDEDDEESWAAYLTRSVVVQNFASLPGVGQIMSAWSSGWGYRANALQQAGEGSVRAIEDASAVFDEDEEVSGSWVKNLFTTAGVLFAKPLGQIGATAQFSYDVASGESEPETLDEWREGAMRGRIYED